MARRTRQQQRAARRARQAAPAVRADYPAAAQPAATAPRENDLARPLVHKALDAAADSRTPSMRLAEAHAVENVPRTNRERAASAHAMDFNSNTRDALTFVQSTGFPGFPILSLLAQLPEYRAMHETLADEVIRMWGKAKSNGNTQTSRLAEIDAEVERLHIRDAVRTLVIQDQAFGRSHAYFKTRDVVDKSLPLVAAPMTVPLGAFLGLRPIEAYWVTPNNYNSIDPTADDFYKPSTWWALGTEVHATRLRTIISRPVPDMLKPAYSFAGVSMTQLAQPYVDNWLRTRQSVSDIVKQYSISGVKCDLAQSLAPGANVDLAMRAELINRYRDNRNILFLDMATEEFFQFSTPLSGLDALQAQAQEQQSAVSHIPLIKLLGITPTGLNASSEGEIRVFYDYVRGYQTNVMSSLMNDVLQFVQLSLFGSIDPAIKWDWAPLLELTALEMAELQNKNADTDAKYLQEQVISPAQIAARLNADPNSLYTGLLANPSDMSDLADADIGQITERILSPQGFEPENRPDVAVQEPEPPAAPPQMVAPPTTNPVAGTPDVQLNEQQEHA